MLLLSWVGSHSKYISLEPSNDHYSLQKTYTGYYKTLKVTGGGLKDDDDDGSEAYNNQRYSAY